MIKVQIASEYYTNIPDNSRSGGKLKEASFEYSLGALSAVLVLLLSSSSFPSPSSPSLLLLEEGNYNMDSEKMIEEQRLIFFVALSSYLQFFRNKLLRYLKLFFSHCYHQLFPLLIFPFLLFP